MVVKLSEAAATEIITTIITQTFFMYLIKHFNTSNSRTA